MKEVLYTIPLNDAVNADTECPFCYIEREVENDLLDFCLGSCSSYMEADVRAMTDEEGFCRKHFQKMFAYGNTLGNAWILKTHYMKINNELGEEVKKFKYNKTSLKDKFKKKAESENSMVNWVRKKEDSCYICKRFDETYERYIKTFFHMYENDTEFRQRIENSKGFCLSHFADLCDGVDNYLPNKYKEECFKLLFDVMQKHMARLQEDVSWLVEKFDYKNKDADWKNSKDAVQRGMQKLKGGIYG